MRQKGVQTLYATHHTKFSYTKSLPASSQAEGRFFYNNNGRIIGGLYGPDSFTSSYPEKEDVYLQEIWKIDEAGRFMERIPGSKGVLVNYDVVEYIEFFNINRDGGENNE